ncbi:ubx domain-containing protein 1 [Plakobranchus ocellatus]|uniref:Ubx domain-containing protein 1 n=1 Tax=Plakobranchus ocellatus TaxID=259542 RepID=A0AAV3XZV3_9GAST|nr:ubx domain-containing protein 1 [Plakobranchus ocellatus]
MESESLQLDDIMATLMSMGFEFNDCQEAMTNGKLTVQAAIDWILAGKPGNVVAPPSLKLNTAQAAGNLQSSSSNPFVQANVDGLQGPSDSDFSASKATGVDVDSDTVISRSHMSEKQQQIKHNFEEKERQEVKRKLNEEKLKKKQEKERILKEIQEDREKLRLTKQAKVDASSAKLQSPPQHSTASASAETSVSPSTGSTGQEKTTPDTAIIQVRLPDGQIFRQTFPSTSTLNTVWDAVYAMIRISINAYSGFIQPFPRREFSREEMSSTLQSLGLVPSGSLVLKKKDVEQATEISDYELPSMQNTWLSKMSRHYLLKLVLDYYPYTTNELLHAARIFTHLHTLSLNSCTLITDAGLNSIKSMTALKVISLSGCSQITNNCFSVFCVLPALQSLILEATGVTDTGVIQFAGSDACHRLLHLDLSRTSVTQDIFTSLQAFKRLKSLFLKQCPPASCRLRRDWGGWGERIGAVHLRTNIMVRPTITDCCPVEDPVIFSYLLKLVLDYYPYTTNELLHAARIFTHLHTLSLNSCTLITDAGLNSIKSMTALKIISLSGCSQITNNCFSVFSVLPALQSLILEATGVTDTGVIQFAGSDVCPRLLHLDLSRTAVTQDIFTCLQGFKRLKSLFLKQCPVSGLAGIESVSSLETLDLSETHIVTDSVLCLTRLPGLCNISLTGTQFVHGDRALSYLKDMKMTGLFLPGRSSTTDLGMAYISGFSLSALDLTNYTNVGDSGMEHIGKIHSLKKLLLTNTKVSDEGIQHLQGLTNLQLLYLDRTNVSNACADVIARFKNLCELSLSSTNVTSDFIKQGALNNCINLTKLNLSKTIIGDKGIIFLKLPNLQLLNLDCTRVHPYTVADIRHNCPNLQSVTIVNLSSVQEDQVEDD